MLLLALSGGKARAESCSAADPAFVQADQRSLEGLVAERNGREVLRQLRSLVEAAAARPEDGASAAPEGQAASAAANAAGTESGGETPEVPRMTSAPPDSAPGGAERIEAYE
jgi:ribosomal protein L12E/L44/L45/RPP1/RPP2